MRKGNSRRKSFHNPPQIPLKYMPTEIQTLDVTCLVFRQFVIKSDACRFDFVKNTIRSPLDCCIMIMCGVLPAAVSAWNVTPDGCVWHTICRVAKVTSEHHGPVLADGPTVCQEGSIFLFSSTNPLSQSVYKWIALCLQSEGRSTKTQAACPHCLRPTTLQIHRSPCSESEGNTTERSVCN
jgi:hypothetical protein